MSTWRVRSFFSPHSARRSSASSFCSAYLRSSSVSSINFRWDACQVNIFLQESYTFSRDTRLSSIPLPARRRPPPIIIHSVPQSHGKEIIADVDDDFVVWHRWTYHTHASLKLFSICLFPSTVLSSLYYCLSMSVLWIKTNLYAIWISLSFNSVKKFKFKYSCGERIVRTKHEWQWHIWQDYTEPRSRGKSKSVTIDSTMLKSSLNQEMSVKSQRFQWRRRTSKRGVVADETRIYSPRFLAWEGVWIGIDKENMHSPVHAQHQLWTTGSWARILLGLC